MDIFEAVDNRKTIRKFDSYIPTKDEIKRIINSARLAPSAMNTQNWKFIAIYNNEIKNKMADEILKTYDRIIPNLDDETKAYVDRYKAHSTFFTKAPVIIVCVETKAKAFMNGVLEMAKFSEEEIKKMRPDSFLLSMGGAIENMLLSAYAQNLGSCWMVAPVLGVDGIKKVLNLDETDKITSVIAIGKPASDISDKRSNKKPLDEIMEIIE